MKSNLNELLSVLEGIRIEKYPDIPAETISKIVKAEFNNQETPGERLKETRLIIDNYINDLFDNEEV